MSDFSITAFNLNMRLSIVQRSQLIALMLLMSTLLISTQGVAQVEVVEGQPAVVTEGEYSNSRIYTSNPQGSAAVATNANSSAELFVQLQALQAEVRELRGLVEQQNYTIEQLSQRRMDDYLDLDRRIGELTSGGSSSSSSASAGGSSASTGGSTQQNTQSASTQNSSTYSTAGTARPSRPVAAPAAPATPKEADEAKQAYRAAYQKVKDRQFDEARVALVWVY